MPHPLHEELGRRFERAAFPRLTVVLDKACGGGQHIPLFKSGKKSLATEYCNVDILIHDGNRIRVIIEIEESDIIPTKICRKFLTAALAPYYMHDSEDQKQISMGDSVLFIQVVDSLSLKKPHTAKPDQLRTLEYSIKSVLPLKGSGVNDYRLFMVNGPDDSIGLDTVIRAVEKAAAPKPETTARAAQR